MLVVWVMIVRHVRLVRPRFGKLLVIFGHIFPDMFLINRKVDCMISFIVSSQYMPAPHIGGALAKSLRFRVISFHICAPLVLYCL